MLTQDLFREAYRLAYTAYCMTETFEAQRSVCSYVHATSRGHEAIQVACGLQLLPIDYASPYYRDDSMLLAMGFQPLELMLQLLAKADDPFSQGRTYYSHPNIRRPGVPRIPHQSSATGMQAIPACGMAQGLRYLERTSRLEQSEDGRRPVVLCSLGDGSVTEGEVAEAFQFSVLHQLPILYLVQDNEWGISVHAEEYRSMNAFEYAGGFKGMERLSINGSQFEEAYHGMNRALEYVRGERRPMLLHARVPLLGHHTSGVRKEWYRSKEDLERHAALDPLPAMRQRLRELGEDTEALDHLEARSREDVRKAFEQALAAADPDPLEADRWVFVPGAPDTEHGQRQGSGTERVLMVDAAKHAVQELLEDHPEAIYYGQDVGRRLGGVFRESYSLAEKFGDHRVFNTAIQEAYIIGSTAGLSAVGLKPIVEVQFGDYIYPGLNQLVSEVAKSSYISCGKYPVSMVLRVPVGAYGGGGPYHSASIESTLLSIPGIKVAYPSNAADIKGLMKAAFLDPNPVVMLEHKGLYWGKVPGTSEAATPEPDREYIVPLGSARIVLEADPAHVRSGESIVVITYGMGVHWTLAAAREFPGQLEILDLRSLRPLDETAIQAAVRRHGKCLLVTEEPLGHAFLRSVAGWIAETCFTYLDAAPRTIGALDVPAIPLNRGLEAAVLPQPERIAQILRECLHD